MFCLVTSSLGHLRSQCSIVCGSSLQRGHRGSVEGSRRFAQAFSSGVWPARRRARRSSTNGFSASVAVRLWVQFDVSGEQEEETTAGKMSPLSDRRTKMIEKIKETIHPTLLITLLNRYHLSSTVTIEYMSNLAPSRGHALIHLFYVYRNAHAFIPPSARNYKGLHL